MPSLELTPSRLQNFWVIFEKFYVSTFPGVLLFLQGHLPMTWALSKEDLPFLSLE